MSIKSGFIYASIALACVSPTFGANQVMITPAAALSGSYGIEVVMGGTNKAYLLDTSPDDETGYRVEFRIDHNDLCMNQSTGHGIFYARKPGANVIRINMSYVGSTCAGDANSYKINVRCLKDTGGTAFCGQITLLDGQATLVKFEWIAASGPGANDGIFRIYKGGTLKYEKTNLDTDTLYINTGRLGAPKNADATTSGSFYIDDYRAQRIPG